ncbi:MAG TPA: hypothetical protein VLA34_02135, partial [Candidatus Krumholzibacterium sp.]|nr:hypothetical protein [Candidatus Krumholzibacterium sp.]
IATGDVQRALEKKKLLESFNPNDPDLLVGLCELSRLTGDTAGLEEYRKRYVELMSDADPGFTPLAYFISKYGS